MVTFSKHCEHSLVSVVITRFISVKPEPFFRQISACGNEIHTLHACISLFFSDQSVAVSVIFVIQHLLRMVGSASFSVFLGQLGAV